MTSTAGMWRRIFPKKRFAWREPKDFVRAENAELAARRPWWVKPGLCLLFSALVMVNWSSATLNPNKHPPALPTALAIAIGGGIVMVYGLPPLIALVPSWVEVHENRISWLRHGSVRFVFFKDIYSVEWTSKRGLTALRIVRKGSKRREVLLGVAPELDTTSLTVFLESIGLKCAHRTESLPSTGF
jgi:hypothetical protein